MEQRVTLNLGKGNCAQGCAAVTAQFWVANSTMPMQITGSLPAAPELDSLYLRWQRLYAALYAHRSWRSSSSGDFEIEADETYPTDVSESAFKKLCDQLHQSLNHWLNADGFRNIDRHLRTRFIPNDEIQVIITAENRQLLRLPWHLWQFFADYPKAEPALSLAEYIRAHQSITSTVQLKANILAILGNAQGINTSNDQQLLQQLPNTQLQFLVEPNLEELNTQLWQPGWDILFFAGHSSSKGEKAGTFQVNANESLAIDQLRFALRKAIDRGLKLAIFNSCDGLNLAWDLADLQIPQVIVMREPVPDRVAQEFLKHFLTAFSSGQSLYLAVREARERLQGLEATFFCASWLPVICQNPAELPMRWEWGNRSEADNKGEKLEDRQQPTTIPTQKSKIIPVLLTSLLATVTILGVRSLGVLQPLELWAFDRLLQLRPQELPDKRFLIVTIDEADIQSQNPQQRQGSLSDTALDQLLNILERSQARLIGLDVYRDFATNIKYPGLIAQLQQNKRLVTICKSSDAKFDSTGIAPPPEVPVSRVGFSDFLADNDGVLRRQLLFHTPDPASPCVAPYAFSTRLALRYLETQGIKPEFTPEGDLKLEQTVFHSLQARTSGYQGIDARGSQILLNYRSLPSLQSIAPQVSLTQILQGKVSPTAIQDRIVLVGVTATSSSDIWTTPYGSATLDRVPGVVVQAHMTSQLISAVLDERSPIWVWHGAGEMLWIVGWAIVGGICVSFRLPLLQSAIVMIGAMVVLIGSCWFLLTQAGWIPLIPAGVAFLITVGIVSYRSRKTDYAFQTSLQK
jgi:CHASE2 domain-containing sensor protein